MHNLFVNQLRQASRQASGRMVDMDDLDHDHELEASSANLGQAVDLQRCLLRLPADQREVLLLVTMEDLSYAAAVCKN